MIVGKRGSETDTLDREKRNELPYPAKGEDAQIAALKKKEGLQEKKEN